LHELDSGAEGSDVSAATAAASAGAHADNRTSTDRHRSSTKHNYTTIESNRTPDTDYNQGGWTGNAEYRANSSRYPARNTRPKYDQCSGHSRSGDYDVRAGFRGDTTQQWHGREFWIGKQ